MKLIKANRVWWDAKSGEMKKSDTPTLINMDQVISIELANKGNLRIPEGFGKIYWVTTQVDNAGHALEVTSKAIDAYMELSQ